MLRGSVSEDRSCQIVIKCSRGQEEGVMSGTTDKIKGRVKEAVGVLTDDQRLKNEGKLDQTVGKIKQTVEQVVDNAKKAIKSSE